MATWDTLRFCKGLGALGFRLKGSIRIAKGYYKGLGCFGLGFRGVLGFRVLGLGFAGSVRVTWRFMDTYKWGYSYKGLGLGFRD